MGSGSANNDNGDGKGRPGWGGIMQGGSKKWVDSKKHGVTQQGTPQTDLIGKRKREGEWLARTVLVGISEFHVGRG